MKCPKCHRDTYSKKWDSCTACNGPTGGRWEIRERGTVVVADLNVTKIAEEVTRIGRGRPKRYENAAAKQKAYRARKAG